MDYALTSAQLYAAAIGEPAAPMKRAQQIARVMEEEFICERWPVGKCYGSELEIAKRFQVGRLVARETVRILQRRGEIQMRSGPGGGLILTMPSVELVMQEVCNYLVAAGVTANHLLEARHVIDAIAFRLETGGRGDNGVIAIAASCLEHLVERFRIFNSETGVVQNEAPAVATRAGQLAREMAAEILQKNLSQGARLGTEAELAERCGVSQSVMRQAIRVLEDCGLVCQQRGRGGGVAVRKQRQGVSVRLLCACMVANGVTMMQGWDAYKLLHVELVRLAARKADDRDEACLGQTLNLLDEWNGPLESLPTLEAECEAATLARNPVLSLFFRASKAFGIWKRLPWPAFPLEEIGTFKAKAAAVIDAIRRRDARAAVNAQHAKHEFLESQLWMPDLPSHPLRLPESGGIGGWLIEVEDLRTRRQKGRRGIA